MMKCPIPIHEMGLHDKVVWNERKYELEPQEKFFALMIAAVADWVRSKNMTIDLNTVTADQIIDIVKNNH
jgi:hypothetical protein